jgi:hypothetical protein
MREGLIGGGGIDLSQDVPVCFLSCSGLRNHREIYVGCIVS